ncbi:unnamed protein product [Hymenolepis diminuta]|uniref:Radial spokehead-like protein n=1 Tax=Hymenolepis diminuta TaxID=6216 RepID=A0A564YCN0_HYMDI|nr:unnamed protein product [Hymenolepis diminuta]
MSNEQPDKKDPKDMVSETKALLMSFQSGENQTTSVYDLMTGIIKYITEHQPSQAFDQFEEISRFVKLEMGMGNILGAVPTKEPKPSEVEFAEKERALYSHPDHVWNKAPLVETNLPESYSGNFEEDSEETLVLGNVNQEFSLIEQSGIGLGREELTRIWLALRHLRKVLGDSVTKLRFWGKVFGIKANYYIIESEFLPGTEPNKNIPGPWDNWRYPKPDPKMPDPESFINAVRYGRVRDVPNSLLRDFPRIPYEPPTRYPRESRGIGLNKWDYYVSSSLGEGTWVRLPSVRPEHIVTARDFVYMFTGDLNRNLHDFAFPGLEVHYLRAQIARISSGTHISPSGVFEIDEELVEEGEQPENLKVAEEYEPMEFGDLLEPINWVHHKPYIFSNGLISWMSRRQAAEAIKEMIARGEEEPSEIPQETQILTDKETNEEYEDEEHEEEDMEPEEQGVDLLATIHEEDPVTVGTSLAIPAWSFRSSTILLPVNCAIAIANSTRWPGAYALARDKVFTNIYMGWGNKYFIIDHKLPGPPEVLEEFDEKLANLVEISDPTEQDIEEARLRRQIREDAISDESPSEILEETE